MPIRIQPFDPLAAPEGLLRRVHDLWCLWDLEYLPDDPPLPYAQRLVDLTWVQSDRHQAKWLAWDGDDLIGISTLMISRGNPEEKNCFARAFVHPEHRGRGALRKLLRPVVEDAQRFERTLITTAIRLTHPSTPLLEDMGLSPVMQEKRSRLVVAEVDLDLMGRWIARAAERATDYRIAFYESPVPEEVLVPFVELMKVMNTAPLEELEQGDEVFTPEIWREKEEFIAESGERILNYVAIHEPSGAYAGFTNINYQGNYPAQAWQWDTGVDPTHRDKGIGRWLKAAMILELIERHPEVERVDTFNAGSNEPMLNINVAMGYKPVLIQQVYQGPLDDVKDWSAQ